MSENIEKTKKSRKTGLAVKIMSGILALLMIISAFSTCIYYIVTTLKN